MITTVIELTMVKIKISDNFLSLQFIIIKLFPLNLTLVINNIIDILLSLYIFFNINMRFN